MFVQVIKCHVNPQYSINGPIALVFPFYYSNFLWIIYMNPYTDIPSNSKVKIWAFLVGVLDGSENEGILNDPHKGWFFFWMPWVQSSMFPFPTKACGHHMPWNGELILCPMTNLFHHKWLRLCRSALEFLPSQNHRIICWPQWDNQPSKTPNT